MYFSINNEVKSYFYNILSLGVESDIKPLLIRTVEEWKGNCIITGLLGITFFLNAIYTFLPGATLFAMALQVGINNKELGKLVIIFNARSLGHIIGTILGAVGFDYFEVPMEKQVMLCVSLMVMALSCVTVPFCGSVYRLSVVMFFGGITLCFCETGISAYTLAMWGENSNISIQFIFAFFAVGSFSVVVIARVQMDESNVEPLTNYTIPDEQRVVSLALVSIYSVFSVFVVLLALGWICIYHFVPANYQIHESLEERRQLKTRLRFRAFAIITTAPLIFIMGLMEIAFPQLFSVYLAIENSSSKEADVVTLFWGFFLLGRITAVIFSYKCFSPFQMIVLSIFLELCSSTIIFAMYKGGTTILRFGSALMGYATAPLLPTTLSWLNRYTFVSSKMIAFFLAVGVTSQKTLSLWLGKGVRQNKKVAFAILFALPLMYLAIFTLQAVVFHREKHLRSKGREKKPPELISLNPTTILKFMYPLKKPSKKEWEKDVEHSEVLKNMDSVTTGLHEHNKNNRAFLRKLEALPILSAVWTQSEMFEQKREDQQI